MPNFFGGLAQGLQGGGLNDAVDYILKQHQAKKLAEALDRTYAGGGAQPAASPDPIAALARLKGGTSATPQAGPVPAPAPQAGPGPMVAPRPQPAPAPQPMPGQPTGAPGASAPTGMAVDPKVSDPFKEGQSIVQNIWQTTRAANPKADPRTILAAVETQLDEVKGVAPITKAVMQGQIQVLKSQADFQFKYAKLDAENNNFMQKMHELKARNAAQEEYWKATEEHQRRVDAINSDREADYGRSVQYAHEDRQAAEAGRNARSSATIDSRMSIAELKESGLDDRSAAAIKGRHGSAIASGLARVMSYQPSADPNSVIAGLEAAYGDQGGGASPSPAKPAPKAGGGVPANVQQFAKQHGLTVIRKRADGKWDAKDKNGTVGVIG